MMDRNKSLQEPTLPENLGYDLFCVVVKIAKSKFACTIGVDKLQPDTLTCLNVKKKHDVEMFIMGNFVTIFIKIHSWMWQGILDSVVLFSFDQANLCPWLNICWNTVHIARHSHYVVRHPTVFLFSSQIILKLVSVLHPLPIELCETVNTVFLFCVWDLDATPLFAHTNWTIRKFDKTYLFKSPICKRKVRAKSLLIGYLIWLVCF